MAAPVEGQPLSEERNSVGERHPDDNGISVAGEGSLPNHLHNGNTTPQQGDPGAQELTQATENSFATEIASDGRDGVETGQLATSEPATREVMSTQHHRRQSEPCFCGKCQQELPGQYVRALGQKFHLECFTCEDCGKIVASKFFPVPDQPPGQYPLCETDYFGRLNLLCFKCGNALRGSYITALDRKYHIEHFTCSVCPTVFGAQDSYYEHDGDVFCHYHYSTKFAQLCNGCHHAILKQFVEIFRNGENQHWHPECYMIHKYWNVRLRKDGVPAITAGTGSPDATEAMRRAVRSEEEQMEQRVVWIWRTLSTFEEKSATCISDMLLHVSNGEYFKGIVSARTFIVFVETLFISADKLDQLLLAALSKKSLSVSREAKLLCKKVVSFFHLLARSCDTGVRRLGVTQELLSLVTGLAHYLKLIIRICLQGSLRLEKEKDIDEGLNFLLTNINGLDDRLAHESTVDQAAEAAAYCRKKADTCPVCNEPVEDRCYKQADRIVHMQCLRCHDCGVDLSDKLPHARWAPGTRIILCSNCAAHRLIDSQGGFMEVTRLTQYVHLLKCAHARLLATLRSSGALPHTSEDPNLAEYDSSQGHRVDPPELEPPMLRGDSRPKSYGDRTEYETENTSSLEGIKRMRSSKMEKHLSMTGRHARTSRVVDGPIGSTVHPGSPGEASEAKFNGMHIVQERDVSGDALRQLTIGGNSLALDDIPRFAAAEQARDQRPNAAKYARDHLIGSEPKPKLINGHRRDLSGGQEIEKAALADASLFRPKRYFSELSGLEHFIVRTLAVILLEPLLGGLFNQEELLAMIGEKRPGNFWGRFGKAFIKNDKGKASGKRKGVFGKGLDQVIERDGAESTDGIGPGTLKVPALVQDAVSAMRSMDMSVEGVFRKNGNIKRLRELAEEIDSQGGDAVDLTKENPVQVAALLKKFLRDLPDPVLTFKLHPLFIAAAKMDENKRLRVLHLTCCLLPKAHRDTMEVLFSFLNWVSSFCAVDEETGSKMDIHNLATVIAPNVLYLNSKNPELDHSFLAIEAVHCLVENNETMSEVPEDLQTILNDTALHANSGEVTTKEILKRYGNLCKAPQTTASSAEVQKPRSREGRPPAPVIQRVDTDPHAWQNESSVRHIGGPSASLGPSSTHNTPPQNPADFTTSATSYSYPPASHEVYGAPNGSPNRQAKPRDSAYAKQGALGITGAG